jgi:carboxypeptidase-like protein
MNRAHLVSVTLLLTLLLMLPSTVEGQGTWVLTGRVLDAQTMGPVPGAFVVPATSDLGTLTDSVGVFALRMDRTPGQAIKISQLGYRDIQTAVSADRAGQILTVVLAPDPVELEGLTVLTERLANRRRGIFGVGEIIERRQLMEAPDVSGYDLVRRVLPFSELCSRDSEALCLVGRRSMGERREVSVCVDGHKIPSQLMDLALAGVDPRGLYLVEAYPNVGEVRMYSPGYMKLLLESGRELPPLSFGCEDGGIGGQ